MPGRLVEPSLCFLRFVFDFMRVLFLDCFSGISGDMTVGALCDLGVKPSTFEWELAKLEIGDFHMHFGREKRQNVEGVKFGIHAGATHTHDQDEEPDEHGSAHAHVHDHDHEHEHEHDDGHVHEHEHHEHGPEEEHDHEHDHGDEHQHGRSYTEIRGLIEASDLSEFVKKHALSIFHRVAVAEAKIHGTSVEDVGFHEVGALDSIADIVLTCVGIEELGLEKIFVSQLADGHGWVDCAHGHFPVPALATLEILQGIPIGQIDEPHEFITPTGAAIAAEFGANFGSMPAMKVERIGYGLGTRKLPNRPNVLRAVVGELAAEAGNQLGSQYATDSIVQIETNIDDLSPEITGALVDRLLGAGALDAFFIPAQMKKNRPGVLLTVLCEPVMVEPVAGIIFRETSSFGLRLSEKRRLKLDRRMEMVQTPHGKVQVKLGFDAGGKLLQVSPEFESCRETSERTKQPIRAIYQAAMQAFGPMPSGGSETGSSKE